MQKFKTLATTRLAVFIAGAVLALLVTLPFVGSAKDKTDKVKDPDSHAQHKDKQTSGDQNLADQITELHAKVAKMEAILKQGETGTPSATPDKGGLASKQDKTGGEQPGGRASAKFQNCVQCHQTRPSGPLPVSHLEAVAKKDVGAKQDGMAGMGDKKTPEAGKDGMGMGMMGGKGMGMMGGKGMGMMGGKGMGMMEGKGMGMMEGKGMGMMEGKGMGMMEGKGMEMGDNKKPAGGMGMKGMDDMKAMGGDKAGMGSTTGMMDQQMMQMMQQMMEMRMEMMEMKMMEMKMNMMKMKNKEMGSGAVETVSDLHAGHKGTPSGTPDTMPHPREVDAKADAGKDLPTQLREIQVRIAALEAALKQRQNP